MISCFSLPWPFRNWTCLCTYPLSPSWGDAWPDASLFSPSCSAVLLTCRYSPSMKSLSNKFMHLTNYSVNKKNAEYQANADETACQGHKWYWGQCVPNRLPSWTWEGLCLWEVWGSRWVLVWKLCKCLSLQNWSVCIHVCLFPITKYHWWDTKEVSVCLLLLFFLLVTHF